jgi:hypothetical protein
MFHKLKKKINKKYQTTKECPIIFQPQELIENIIQHNLYILPNITQTCSHFYTMEFSNNLLQFILNFVPRFIFSKKWFQLFNSPNLKINNHLIPKLNSLIFQLILSNSLNFMTFLCEKITNFDPISNVTLFEFKKYFTNETNYLYFCYKIKFPIKYYNDKIFIVNHSILLFVYMFGTTDMVKILLNYNILNINTKPMFKSDNIEIGNIDDFISEKLKYKIERLPYYISNKTKSIFPDNIIFKILYLKY